MNVRMNGVLSVLVVAGCLWAAGCSKNGAAHQGKPSDDERPKSEPVVIVPKEGQVVVEQPGLSHVDEATGKLCWPAMTCTEPSCMNRGPDGGPYLFPFKIEGTVVGTNGEVVWPENGGPDSKKWTRCPLCGLTDGVREYEPPEVVRRKQQLHAELAASRAAHKSARRQSRPTPTNHREPNAILDEIAKLPRVFIMDDGQ